MAITIENIINSARVSSFRENRSEKRDRTAVAQTTLCMTPSARPIFRKKLLGAEVDGPANRVRYCKAQMIQAPKEKQAKRNSLALYVADVFRSLEIVLAANKTATAKIIRFTL